VEWAVSLEPIALIAGGLLLLWLAIEAICNIDRGLRGSIKRFWARLGLDDNPRMEVLDRIETIFYGLVGLGLIMAGLARLGV
jgi:hypothetical protein